MLASAIIAPGTSDASTRPGADNTGVPDGVALKKWVGDMKITTPGAVIDGYDIYGNVTVEAPDVTISRTRIRGTTAKVQRDLLRAASPSASGLSVLDVTIKPDTPTVYQRIGIRLSATDQVVRRADISGTVDGVRISGERIVVENSWLHDFGHYTWDPEHSDGSHDDAIQVEGGSEIRILNNSITGAYNAAVMAAQGLSTLSDMWINSNFVDGGACAINIARKSKPYMKGLQVSANRFGRNLRFPKCPLIYVKADSDLLPKSNVWDDTGGAIPLP